METHTLDGIRESFTFWGAGARVRRAASHRRRRHIPSPRTAVAPIVLGISPGYCAYGPTARSLSRLDFITSTRRRSLREPHLALLTRDSVESGTLYA